MSDISKKYVKALIKSVKKNKLEEILTSLKVAEEAFKNLKFRTLLYANDISKDKKVDFLLELSSKKEDKILKNFYKVLAYNNRLELIPEIAKELEFEIAKILNKHKGLVISNKKFDKNKINKIAKQLEKKFNTKIDLDYKKSDYNGIKVEVETLGVEIAFSADRLKSQLKEFILKSI